MVTRSKSSSSRSIFSFLIQGLIEAVLLIVATVIGSYYASYFIEDGLLTRTYGDDVFDLEEWPAGAYEMLNRVDYITDILVVLVIILIIAVIARRTRNRIVRPLAALNDAIAGLKESRRVKDLPESGLSELDNILASWNELATELEESEERRRRLESDRRRMLTGVSHDLRTPLTVIRGYSRAICDGIPDEETQSKYIQTIYNKSVVMTELVDSFYEYSKLQHPAYTPLLSVGDFSEYLREYLASRYEELEIAGFELYCDIPDEPVICEFDPYQFKRVLENIISNALKYNKRGTEIYVHVHAEDSDDRVILLLGDDGKGVPEELAKSIFDPFVSGNATGTEGKIGGLGLTVSRSVVLAHGGTIELTPNVPSHDGRVLSTAFRIVLPRKAA